LASFLETRRQIRPGDANIAESANRRLEREGHVSKQMKIWAAGALVVLGAGLLMTGCKSAPDLSKPAALALIQADYDKRPAEPATIAVDELGLKQGINSNLWKLTKVYPNNRWADYALTDNGKKSIKLAGTADSIQWRPEEGSKDFHFFVITVAANHLKAKDVGDAQDDVVANVQTAKSAGFTEVYDWTGIPDSVQTIAHNAINRLSTRRQADFALVNGAWTVHSIN
jgi:hypothetical protein